tara:strand:+ start:835 stop:1263 length:429 start_codon:yes stop_codon:yes gene_type:complete
MQTQQLARAVAVLFWADEKDTPEEWAAAENLFVENKCDWEEAKALIEEEIEDLIDESDNDEEVEETEEDLDFEVIDLGPEIEPYKILTGLAAVACSDKILTWKEIDILHCLGDAMNIPREMVTAALIDVSQSSEVSVKLPDE